jgi:hypothetical protein
MKFGHYLLASGAGKLMSDIITASKTMSDRRELHQLPAVSRANLFAD